MPIRRVARACPRGVPDREDQHRLAQHPGRAATSVSSRCAVSCLDRGATLIRRQNLRRRNQPITSAVDKARIGPSATASFRTNQDRAGSGGKPCIADRISGDGQERVLDAEVSRPGIGRNETAHEQPAVLLTAEAATPADFSYAGSRPGFGTAPKIDRNARWSSRAIEPADRTASPGQSPTATAAIITTQVGKLSMVCSRRTNP